MSVPPVAKHDLPSSASAGTTWTRQDWMGVAVWVGLALAVAAPRAWKGFEPATSVPTIYRTAACNWIAGNDLYVMTGTDFLYYPLSAAMFTPFASLPEVPGAFLWRLTNVALFGWGIFVLTRLAQRRYPGVRYWLTSLIAAGLSWSAARHGQMTLAMGGLMFVAMGDLIHQRWGRAAFWLALSVAIKPLSIVLLLLVAALYPRTILPLLLSMVAMLLLPFCMQRPEYVWGQMLAFRQSLTASVEVGLTSDWTQLFAVFEVVGIEIARGPQTVIRMVAALGTLILCFVIGRRQNAAVAAIYTVTLAVGYILLFNMRSERNTYALLAPMLGLFIAMAQVSAQRGRLAFLTGISLAMLLSHPLGRLLTGSSTDWMKPALCLVFMVGVIRWGLQRDSEKVGKDELDLAGQGHRVDAGVAATVPALTGKPGPRVSSRRTESV